MIRRISNKWVLVLVAIFAFAMGSALTARAANLAAGKLAFASYNNPVSGNGTDTTANLTDNNFGTAWTDVGSVSAPTDQAGVDLGAVTAFRYARFNWTTDHPTAFTIEVADTVDTDPSSFGYGTGDWAVIYTRTADPAGFNVANDFIDLGAQNHRFVRVNATASSSTAFTWGINEFQVLDLAPAITGIAQFGATPVGDTIVQLDGPSAVAGGPPTVVQNIKTDASGAFNFIGLYDGTYLLVGIPAGKYAPVQATVVVSGGTPITQNLTCTTPVVNSAATTAPLPGYLQDDIGNVGESNAGSATSNGYILPSDELPAQPTGDAIWNTGDANGGLPASATAGIGAKVPAGLHFWFPPYASGKNNVLTPANATLPVPNAHYTAIYIVQGASGTTGGNYDCFAYLNYTDGTVQPITTIAGTTTYHITDGTQTQNEDEFNAFTVDKRILAVNGTATPETNTPPAFRVFLRFILTDSTKVLKSVTFGPGFAGNSTTVSGFIYAWSGDVLATDTIPAVGSISGTIKAPVSEGGGPVTSAVVDLFSYRAITDATGKYSFRGLPADTYSVSALKPANYPLTTVSHALAAGANDTVDIQFPYPVPVISDPLTSPNLDEISTDDPAHAADAANPGFFGDFSATGYALGSEYMPHGKYSPNSVSDPLPDPTHHNGSSFTNWQATTGAPGALSFDFGDPTKDSPVIPGTAGFPLGGVPNTVCIHDFELLAPQTNILNCYLAITGLDGAINLRATLHYADGTSEVKPVQVSDWYQPPSSNEYSYVTMHGRHTSNTGRTPYWEDGVGGTGTPPAAAANIFIKALVIPCNSAKILHDITFDHGDQQQKYPIVTAISWETSTPQPVSSDIRVTVTKSDSTPAAGAWIVMGPYSTQCDATGVGVFKGVPANQTVDLGAFLYGQSKQARVSGHLVPVGMKMPTPDDVAITLPADAPVFVQLPLAYDYDMISMSDMVGDYKGAAGNDAGYNGDLMPPSNTIVQDSRTAGIPILMPMKETYYNNCVRMNGQTWNVTPGHYSALTFLVTGQGVGSFPNAFYDHMTMNYTDGTSEQVQTAHQDWVGNWAAPGTTTPKNLFYRALPPADPTALTYVGFNIRSRRNCSADEQRAENSSAAWAQQMLPINAGKVLKSITLNYMFSGIGTNDFSILAATLEANDVQPEATVTGTVVGQPIGETASGPLNQAMVVVDDSHMAYTAADGTFTVPHVAPGTYNVKVIPVGQGILTKTVSATFAAGANSMGTIDTGTAVRYIYAVIGPTNQEKGLHLVQGVYNGYVTDSNRPNNLVNVTDSLVSPIVIGGKAGMQSRVDNVTNAGDYFYFQVDKGWLYHGRIGDPGTVPATDINGILTAPGRAARGEGMDLSTFIPNTTYPTGGASGITGWKPGPHVYITVEYYDNAKAGQTNASLGLNYDRMEGWQHSSTSTNWVTSLGTGPAANASLLTIRMTDAYRTPQIKNSGGTANINYVATLGSTNTWKTFTWNLDPVYNNNVIGLNTEDAFGAYGNENLEADFRISPNFNSGDNPRIIRSVIISLDPTPPTLPATPSAKDALKIAAGLVAADATTLAVDDVVAPAGKITVQDAIALAKQGLK